MYLSFKINELLLRCVRERERERGRGRAGEARALGLVHSVGTCNIIPVCNVSSGAV